MLHSGMLTHPDFPIEELTVGHIVWFYDEDKFAHPLLITAIDKDHYTFTDRNERPYINGSIFLTSGMVRPVRRVRPAYEDEHGTYRLMIRWSLPQEIPLISPTTGEQNYAVPGFALHDQPNSPTPAHLRS